jgi:hypothetical protein
VLLPSSYIENAFRTPLEHHATLRPPKPKRAAAGTAQTANSFVSTRYRAEDHRGAKGRKKFHGYPNLRTI